MFILKTYIDLCIKKQSIKTKSIFAWTVYVYSLSAREYWQIIKGFP